MAAVKKIVDAQRPVKPRLQATGEGQASEPGTADTGAGIGQARADILQADPGVNAAVVDRLTPVELEQVAR